MLALILWQCGTNYNDDYVDDDDGVAVVVDNDDDDDAFLKRQIVRNDCDIVFCSTFKPEEFEDVGF